MCGCGLLDTEMGDETACMGYKPFFTNIVDLQRVGNRIDLDDKAALITGGIQG